jgi:hypothetical protein
MFHGALTRPRSPVAHSLVKPEINIMTHTRLLGGVLGLLVALSIGPSVPAANEPKENLPIPKPPQLKVLEKFVGTWNIESLAKPTEAVPRETRSKGVLTSEWTLDGWFLRSTSKTEPGSISVMQLISYNSGRKEYYTWLFDSMGFISEMEGQWDEDTDTLTWKAEPAENVTTTQKIHFVNKDTIEWTLITKDKDGKIYLNVSGKMTRKKKE